MSQINREKYDICIVLRRNLNIENQKLCKLLMQKKFICIENISKNKLINQEFLKLKSEWINVNQNNQNINEYDYYKNFLIKLGFNIKNKNSKINNPKINSHKKLLLI